jgi:hypothetical protein
MTIQEIISSLQEGKELSIEGVPFTPSNTEEIRLSTGETLFFSYSQEGTMLSVDVANEECDLLEACDEEMDLEEEVQVYDGRDYEFSLEVEGRVVVEDELTDELMVRDYEAKNGRTLRTVEYHATGDICVYEGRTVSEDEIVEGAE